MSRRTRWITIFSFLTVLALLAGTLQFSQPRGGGGYVQVSGSFAHGGAAILPADNKEAHQDKQAQGAHKGNDKGAKRNSRKSSKPRPTIDVAQAIALLNKLHPALAAQITKLNREDPQKAEQMLLHHYRWVRWLLQMKKHDPKGYALRVQDIKYSRQSHDLAVQINKIAHGKSKAKGPKADKLRDALQKKLQQVLEKQFDVRQQMRQHELGQLQDQIKRLQKQLQTRAKRKDQMIKKQMNQLLHQAPKGHHKKRGQGKDRHKAKDKSAAQSS